MRSEQWILTDLALATGFAVHGFAWLDRHTAGRETVDADLRARHGTLRNWGERKKEKRKESVLGQEEQTKLVASRMSLCLYELRRIAKCGEDVPPDFQVLLYSHEVTYTLMEFLLFFCYFLE
jgi:hypothetical protein